jgi:hypothetical protein
MKYAKKQKILVVDHRGRKHIRYVWKDDGDRVFVTSLQVIEALENGDSKLSPIPFPKSSVSLARDESR